MKILHIIAQKPNSTGSGIYMCGIIEGFGKLGYKQGVIAGIDIKDDINCFSKDILFYPVKYNTQELDFPVLGMSDSMPYNSTRYRDLDNNMIKKFKKEFKSKIEMAINEFKPDLIICHHLYLLTALTRDIVKDIKVVGLCHGTCLRQLKTIELEKDYIISNISKLDEILALHQDQKEEIEKIFKIDKSKVKVIGSGFNSNIFYNKDYKLDNKNIDIVYAGKLCKSKGLKSLIRSVSKLEYPRHLIKLNIAGMGNDLEQYEEILKTAKYCDYEVNFLGKLTQEQLSELLNKSHIFTLPSFYEGLPVVVLEALACGTEVVTTDIDGVKEWIGRDINESGKIDYVGLPKMKMDGIPFEEGLHKFEEDLYNKLKDRIDNIINNQNDYMNIDMSERTWDGVSYRMSKYIS